MRRSGEAYLETQTGDVIRQTPGFTADSSLDASRGHYAAEASGKLETVLAPAQLGLLSRLSWPRYVWDNEGCPPGQRRVFIEGYHRYWCWDDVNMRSYPCDEFVPARWECWPNFHVVSDSG
jgi:hypothetical protein